MIIKKFTAPTLAQALSKVREELGTDAIILNTRNVKKGGVLNLMGSSVYEVTAAIDDKPPGESMTDLQSNVRDLSYRVQVDHIIDDIKELKLSIRDLADSALTGEMDGLPIQLATLLKRLRDSGMDEKIAKRLIRQLLSDLKGHELTKPKIIADKATAILMSGMGEVRPIPKGGTKPRIIAFVGPTGSGKTTTIAKLATEISLNMNKKIAVLNIDTKRVDAVGQLKAYCRIINIPLYVAYSPDEIPGIMPRIMENDITLVDTPGSGPMDRPQMIEMIEFLQKLVPQEVHLTLSVTTSFMEMKRVFNNFGLMKPNRILFTKLDETDNYGTMLSFALVARERWSYVTFGQNVPGDFDIADPEKLIRETIGMKESS